MIESGDVWHAIDEIAEERHESLTALARSAHLDPTTFNPSKRQDRVSGKPRWPSLSTVTKLLHAVRLSMARFGAMVDRAPRHHR